MLIMFKQALNTAFKYSAFMIIKRDSNFPCALVKIIDVSYIKKMHNQLNFIVMLSIKVRRCIE